MARQDRAGLGLEGELGVDVAEGVGSGSLGKEGPTQAVWRRQQVTQAPK